MTSIRYFLYWLTTEGFWPTTTLIIIIVALNGLVTASRLETIKNADKKGYDEKRREQTNHHETGPWQEYGIEYDRNSTDGDLEEIVAQSVFGVFVFALLSKDMFGGDEKFALNKEWQEAHIPAILYRIKYTIRDFGKINSYMIISLVVSNFLDKDLGEVAKDKETINHVLMELNYKLFFHVETGTPTLTKTTRDILSLIDVPFDTV